MAIDIQRIIKHLVATRGQINRAFPKRALQAIEQAIVVSENQHQGEIRFAVESGLDGWPLFQGQRAKARALEVFSQLRVWDTEHNTGILIYLLLADRAVEIVADRAIHARLSAQEWRAICTQMEVAFKQANFEAGVLEGIRAVTAHLVNHFPAQSEKNPVSLNELPNRPVLI